MTSIDIEKERNARWHLLFKLYEFYIGDRPAYKPSISQLEDDLQGEFPKVDVFRIVTYLCGKGLVSARFNGGQLDIYDIAITSDGIDYIETAIELHQASKKKRPPGFGAWREKEIPYKTDAVLKDEE